MRHQQLARRHRHRRRSNNSRQLAVQRRGSQVICCKQFASQARGKGLGGIRNTAAVEMTNRRQSPLYHPSCLVNISFKARKSRGPYESRLREALLGSLCAAAVSPHCGNATPSANKSLRQPSPRGLAATTAARKRCCITQSHEN